MRATRLRQAFVLSLIPILIPPVPGPILRRFDAAGPYSPGQRGISFQAPPGTPVVAPIPGTVTFSGSVAGHQWITIQHTSALLVTVGPLSTRELRRSDAVQQADLIGTAEGPMVLLTVRRDGAYIDPAPLFSARRHARLIPMRQFEAQALQ